MSPPSKTVLTAIVRGLFLAVLVNSELLSTLTNSSELLTRDGAFIGIGGSQDLAGLELDKTGRVYWWHIGGESRNEGAVEGTVGWFPKNVATTPQGYLPYYSLRGAPVGGAAFDNNYVYHTTPRGVERRQRDGNPNGSSLMIGRDFGSMPGVYQPGAAAMWKGELYFAMMSDTPILDIVPRGRFLIHAMAVGAYPTPPDTSSRLVADGSAHLNTQLGALLKLGFVAQPIGGGEIVWGLALAFNGDLLRFSTRPIPGLDQAAHRIASGVTDFVVRRENVRVAGQFFGEERDVLYVTLNEQATGRSRLITLDPTTDAIRELYTAEPNRRLTAVGQDEMHLFAAERDLSCSTFFGTLICTPGEGRVRSKTRGNGYRLLTGEDPDANWAVVEAGVATHIRSDGKNVFFTRGPEIRRFPSDAPPLIVNFQALSMEVVQAIQDLNNSVPLIEGKPAFVRAYARVTKDTSGRQGWEPESELRGRLNGSELGTLRPLRSAWIDGHGQTNIGILRVEKARTFLFELPPKWVQAGSLDLTFTVNPSGALPEQGPNVGADNSASARLQVVRSRPLQLVFHTLPVKNTPDYNPGNDGEDFAGTIARALALLPATEIRVRFHPTPVGEGPYDLSADGQDNKALAELRELAALERATEAGAEVYHVGAVDRRAPGFNGIGDITGRSSLVRMEPYSLNRPGYNTPYGGRTLAHELGHNLGRRHIDHTMTSDPNGRNNQPAGPFEPYPYDGASLGMAVVTNFSEIHLPGVPFGFDTMLRAVVPPYVGGDLLSYSFTRWTSRETWATLLRAIAGPLALNPISVASFARTAALQADADPTGPVLMVSGHRDPVSGAITVRRVRQLPAGVIDPVLVAESFRHAAELPPGLQLRSLDGAGVVLEARPLVLDAAAGDGPHSESFLQFLPAPDPVARVEIVDNANVALVEETASANPPAVVFTSPPLSDEASGTVQLEFDLADADGDLVTAALQFSADDGKTWQALGTSIGASPLTVDMRRTAGGDLCRFRLVATDGFLATVATTDAVKLPRHRPELFVSGVTDNQVLDYGVDILLNAVAFDGEDGGIPNSAVSWSITGPTVRAAASGRFTVQELSPGSYTAEAMTSDSESQATRQAFRFEVRPAIVPDTVGAPEMDGEVNDGAYQDALNLPLAPGGSTRVRLTHVGNALHVGVSGLRYTGQATAATFALRINLSGLGGAKPGTGDVRFSVDEFGYTSAGRGDDAGFALDDQLAGALTASVWRGADEWSAEIRIHQNALGGWDHPARLLLEHNYLVPADPTKTLWPPDVGTAEVPNLWASVQFGRMNVSQDLALTAVLQADGTLRLTWPTSNSTCVLEQADDLTPTGWRPVKPAATSGSYDILPTEGARFYRLRCQ